MNQRRVALLGLGIVVVGFLILFFLLIFSSNSKEKFVPLVLYKDGNTEVAFFKCDYIRDRTGGLIRIEGVIESCDLSKRACVLRPANYCQTKFGKISFGLAMSNISTTYDRAGNSQPAIFDSKFYFISRKTGEDSFSDFFRIDNASELTNRSLGNSALVSFDYLDNIYFIDSSRKIPVANAVNILEQ